MIPKQIMREEIPLKSVQVLWRQQKRAGYQAVYREHQREYGALYQSMVLKINEEETEKYSSLEVPELLKRSREDGISAYLSALLFAYARYLMICSSFDCALPANLQGIWNGSYTPHGKADIPSILIWR